MELKKMKEREKAISNKSDIVVGSDGVALISVKAENSDQIFSSFDYDSNEKLNAELSDYIYEKAENVPHKMDLRLKIFSFDDVDEKEVKSAVRRNFERQYLREKLQNRRNWILIFLMTIFGLMTLTTLFLSYEYFENIYLDTILEIATWVFFWEAVDALVLKRAGLRHKKLTLLKLCTCEIEVVKLPKKKREKLDY